MHHISGQGEIQNALRLTATLIAGGSGFDIRIGFENLNNPTANNSFPAYDFVNFPTLTMFHGSSGRDKADIFVSGIIPFTGFTSNQTVSNLGQVHLKPGWKSASMNFFCILKPDQWQRMREIANIEGTLDLKLLVSSSFIETRSILEKNTYFWAPVVEISIKKTHLEEFIAEWTKTNDSMKDIPPDIPEDIFLALLEASKCLDIEASKASVIMTRRALQKGVLEKGAEGKNLFDQIDDLKEKGKLSNDVASLAHGVRFLGNYGAHPDETLLNEITLDDARLSFQVTSKILRQLFNGSMK